MDPRVDNAHATIAPYRLATGWAASLSQRNAAEVVKHFGVRGQMISQVRAMPRMRERPILKHKSYTEMLGSLEWGFVMDMIRVVSSAILSVGYEPATQHMKITFIEGHTYDFCSVPADIFAGLLRAGSKGRYYNDYIKDRYRC